MTTEADCLDALHRAADHLDSSPSKADYEQLGFTPASATIIRVCGGWNDAKRAAGLETAPSTGSRVHPKPEDVDLPEGMEWENLTANQRWHYRYSTWNAERTLARRDRQRAWLYQYKEEKGCARCSEMDAACLDFHHLDSAVKRMNVSKMVSYGYSLEKIEAEIERCTILCSNCHRKEHYTKPTALLEAGSEADES